MPRQKFRARLLLMLAGTLQATAQWMLRLSGEKPRAISPTSGPPKHWLDDVTLAAQVPIEWLEIKQDTHSRGRSSVPRYAPKPPNSTSRPAGQQSVPRYPPKSPNSVPRRALPQSVARHTPKPPNSVLSRARQQAVSFVGRPFLAAADLSRSASLKPKPFPAKSMTLIGKQVRNIRPVSPQLSNPTQPIPKPPNHPPSFPNQIVPPTHSLLLPDSPPLAQTITSPESKFPSLIPKIETHPPLPSLPNHWPELPTDQPPTPDSENTHFHSQQRRQRLDAEQRGFRWSA